MTLKTSTTLSALSAAKVKPFFLLVIATLTLSACSKDAQEQTKINNFYQSASINTISEQQGYKINRSYLGQLKAKQQTNLSFEYSGKINQILVDNGDIVNKNQLLAKQDTQLLEYKTSELQAQINQAEAQIKLNQANLSRIKTLINDGYSSKQRLDELNAENQILNAQITGLNAQINTLNYQINKTNLRAPFDGVITSRLASQGEVISASAPAFKLIEQSNNEINVGVPDKLAMKLSIGETFELNIANKPQKTYQARLIAIGQQIDMLNRTVQLRLKLLEQSNENLQLNGQLVRVNITEQVNKAGFWLPLSAITDGVRGQWQIFIAKAITNKQNHYQLQTTTVNVIHTNEHSVYVTGLPLTPHTIVSQGVHRYVGGQIVTSASQEQLTQQQLTSNRGNQ